MQICNSCGWTEKKQDCEKTEFLESLCPDCNAITTEGKGHEYDDEGICKKKNAILLAQRQPITANAGMHMNTLRCTTAWAKGHNAEI